MERYMNRFNTDHIKIGAPTVDLAESLLDQIPEPWFKQALIHILRCAYLDGEAEAIRREDASMKEAINAISNIKAHGS